MESDQLPSENDVIVLGTGMTESIIAAALSRIGLRVLHLDRNDNYGGDWGAFNFTSLQQWITTVKEQTESSGTRSKEEIDLSPHLLKDESLILLPIESSTICNVEESIHIPGAVEPSKSDDVDISVNSDDNHRPLNDSSEAVSDAISSADGNIQSKVVDERGELGVVEQQSPVEDDGKQVSEETETASKTSGAGVTLDFAGVKKQWRKFSIDLMPKILYNRGSLVELLISSDVSKYCEFRCITRVLTMLKDKLEVVPCSRADVFASHDVSVIEKRLLMKFLTFAIEYEKHPDQYRGFEEKPFVAFLKSRHLTETIQHYVQHAIAMVTETANTLQGLEATQKFLVSLGRYGNTAFLWPLYGSGELLQCFCRMCAVFGGVYCLRRSAKAVVFNSSKEVCAVIDTGGQRLNTKWLIMDASYASKEFLPQIANFGFLSRCILITDRSVKPHKEQQMTVMSLPFPGRNDCRVTVYELSSLSATCPEGFHVVHLICKSLSQNAESDLQPIVQLLFRSNEEAESGDQRPCIIWSLYFNTADSSAADLTCNDVKNLFVVGGPDNALDCDQAVAVAKRIFTEISPGEEFLPRAPNPEDIIFDDGETLQSQESGFETIHEDSTEAEVAN